MTKSTVDLKALLKNMTLEQKIGQLIQLNANFFTKSESEITGPVEWFGVGEGKLRLIGSTLNFQGADEMKTIQDKHLAEDPNNIPMVFMMDVIHGFRTIYPIPLALGCSFDPELVADCSRMAAKEASAGGVQVTFTPMVDYVRDARWGRVMETCGEDPYLNSVMGATQVKAFQGDDMADPDHVATCVKHFAAYGGAEAGRDYNTVELSEHILREFYFPAYKACLDAGSPMVMPSFNNLNGVPSVANKWLMNKILRQEWGFDGVVISDYAAVNELCGHAHSVAENLKQAAKLAFECGCDIEMMSPGYSRYLQELVEQGTVTEEQVDRAVMRVLELKRDLGLFEDAYHGASAEKEMALAVCPEHRAIARRAAEESAVLLKNNGVLPLSTDIKTVAIIGPFADNNQIKGFWSCNGRDEDCVTVKEGVQALLPNAEILVARGCSEVWNDYSTDGFAEAIETAKRADAVILCVGENQAYSGEGNCRTDLRLPGVQSALVKEICAANANTAVVLFNGRPLVLSDINDVCPAILDMWFPGSEGGSAAANLLFGKVNPSGKLSMSFPKAVGQCPIYYNRTMTGRPKSKGEDVHQPYSSNYIDCGNLPLYFFGEGRSYTTFEYESMTLDRKEMTADQTITVTVTLRNAGERTGKETVQLYLRDMASSTVRPIQELIAFEKVELAAGETKTVTFTVKESMLRLWNTENEFVSEKGTFRISVGYADHMAFTEEFKLV